MEGISFVYDKYQTFPVISGKFKDVDGEFNLRIGKYIVNGETEFISELFSGSPGDIENSLSFENGIIGIK